MDEIIVKINKLLSKAEHTANKNEKMLFYKKAQELIVQNDIKEGELDMPTEADIQEIYSEWLSVNFKDWYWKLLDVIAENHNCLSFRRKANNCGRTYRFVFIGERTKATIAALTIHSLVLQLKPKSVSYRLGFIEGLKKEYEKTWEHYSLVPVVPTKAQEMYDGMEITFVEALAQQTVSDWNEYEKGKQDGGRYTYHKLEDDPQEKLLIG